MVTIHERKKLKIDEPTNELCKLYPHDVTFFENRPDGEFNLKEIEQFTEQRLQVMMVIKQAKEKGFAYMSDDWKKRILEMLIEYDIKDYVLLLYHTDFKKTLDAIERRRHDLLSHYMLVLASCSNETKRNFIIDFESDMFHIKFNNLSDVAIHEFIKIHQSTIPQLKLMQNNEKNIYREDLLSCTNQLTTSNFESTDFYKVPFTSAIDLLDELNCFVRKGFIYVPHYSLVYVFKIIFINRLQKHLSYYCGYMKENHNIFEERLQPIINNASYRTNELMIDVHNHYVQTNENNSKMILESFDRLAQQSFPLCTRNLVDVMQRHHHLKYHGRQLLQLFLKGIGLTVDDCLTLFRNEFTKIMDNKVFDKEYGYYIQYNYGLKGNKINVAPPNCSQVFNDYPKANANRIQFHGCPFKDWDISLLEKRLYYCKLNSEEISQISNLANQGHAQVACSKFFEFTHGGGSESVGEKRGTEEVKINHPNQFFKESRKYFSKIGTNNTEQTPKEHSTNLQDTTTTTTVGMKDNDTSHQ